jgi:hypothetical protein
MSVFVRRRAVSPHSLTIRLVAAAACRTLGRALTATGAVALVLCLFSTPSLAQTTCLTAITVSKANVVGSLAPTDRLFVTGFQEVVSDDAIVGPIIDVAGVKVLGAGVQTESFLQKITPACCASRAPSPASPCGSTST